MPSPLAFEAWPALLGAIATFYVSISALSITLGFALERRGRERRIWALPLDPGQLRHELIGNLVFLAIAIATSTLVLHADVARLAAESWPRAIATFVALNFGFQVYYYFLHRIMHHRQLVRFHRWHHVSRVTTPLSGQSMSWVETLGWMLGYLGLPIAFSLLSPISLYGAIAYVGYNVFGNIVGHANVELVPVGPGLRLRSLFTNTLIYHALHHARWRGHYGFAAALMDRACGTEWADWMPLHARVASGQPLQDLRERAS